MSDGQEPQGEEGGEQQVGWTSEIHEAVWQNNTEKVRQLINSPQGAPLDLEAVVEDCTPLYLACLKGHTDVAEILIKGGAKVDGDSPPVFAAAGKGNLDLVRLLLKNGANPSAFSSQHAGCCGLHIAAEKNYVDVVRALLEAGVEVNIRSEKQKLTPLISAACCGSLDAVKVLIEAGADVDAQSSTGNTALMLAIDRGKIDVATTLIDSGANLEIKGQKGWTALHNAASGGDKGYREVAEALLKANASVDALSETMLTPLHEAAGKSLTDLVRLLVDHGANVNARDKFNNTPLRMCASNAQSFASLDSFKQTVQTLLDAGADINAGTTINTTSLHSVVKWGNPDAVRFMLDHGADPNVRTTKGELPIDFAKEPAIRALLEPVTKAAAKTDKPTNGPADAKGAKADKNVSRSKYSHDNWQPDNTTPECMHCSKKFTLIVRKCTPHRMRLPDKGMKEPVRVCVVCADTNTNTKAKSN
ncbi:FYVE zinc finger domain/Ankyrin repeatcontaining protein [Acanthamoeba castellanii str. Neff]|uniref:FYVE zinc finger domain/Ankyrin repeatcontaining protein n=1 Tax=Acanthamoeba castellanii (strain ATCC 30010 / Neff) TaxID=1257118 RepID=L8HM44_ACACF|nr:FYVE zinc finger domain/Ankyrin repeatcontaining protein [Acanthamoeba castellanii str. Neff]ELR25728.1 FYVE zinc finger domain/Ankyrin repeatcontaining protein [Acanthamoeba castellanii str. Neff]